MYLIVGLGNPGEKYDGTRHNLGFVVVNKLAADASWSLEKKFKAETCKTNNILLIKPQTYMNESGLAVKALVDFYKISASNIIIIHDDLDLPLGKIKIRKGGAAGGHHGVESVINNLKDDQFIRVRLGIGNLDSQRSEKGTEHVNIEHFVLESFLLLERSKAKTMIKNALKAVGLLLEDGLESAQNQYN